MKILLLLSFRLISKHKARSAAVALLYAVVFFALFFVSASVCAYIDYMSYMKSAFKDTVIYYKNVTVVFAVSGLGVAAAVTALCGITLLLIRCLKRNGELFPYYGFTFRHFLTVLLPMNAVLSLSGAVAGLAALPLSDIFIEKTGMSFNGFTFVPYLVCAAVSALSVSFFAALALYRGKIKKPVRTASARKLPISSAPLLIGVKSFIFDPSFSETAAAAAIILVLGGFFANVVEFASFLNNSSSYDIAVYAYDTSYTGELMAHTNCFFGMTENDLKTLEAVGGLSLTASSGSHPLVRERDGSLTDVFGEGKEYAQAKAEFGFEDSDVFSSTTITSYYNDVILSKTADHITDGEIDPERFYSGEEVIAVAYPGKTIRKVGDVVDFSLIWYDGSGKANRTDFSAVVGATAEIGQQEALGFPVSYGFYTSDNFMRKTFPDIGYNHTYLYLDDLSRVNEVNAAIDSIRQRLTKENDGYFRTYNSIQERAMAADFSAATKIIVAAVNVILMFVSLFYLISSVLVKLDGKKNMLSVLRILGMSKAKIIAAVMTENLLNAVWSLTVGAAEGTGCVLISEKLLGENISVLMPTGELFFFSVMFILSVALTSFIACAANISDKREIILFPNTKIDK
ncbi:MAG: FtsX-like permease family protein [Bacteroides sp.]|nr:FtsX-like permease family protein [Bacteroides sp.]